MAAMTLASQGAALVTGIMSSNFQASAAKGVAGLEAHAARYQGAVDANMALIQAENQARVSEAQAEANEFNARVSEQEAAGERVRAGAEANDFRRAQEARAASARARQAASGLALEGSPLMVDENVFTEIEFGAARIGHAGDVAATRLTNQARLQKRSAEFERESAKFSREAGRKAAQYAVEGGNIRATGAITSGNLKATAARISGIGEALGGASRIGQTLNGMGVPSFG